MRMWMVPPSCLCKKHLLGEHGEIHKHRHNFIKHHSIRGRVFPVAQIELVSMKSRHDELAEEMQRRGYNHNSPYEQPDLSYLNSDDRNARVDINISVRDLYERCIECACRLNDYYEEKNGTI